ncbi:MULTISPECIES: CHAP domain-containing protein [Streptococcus]|uniref:CHAP domain-containing protein n=1 Tax=Streptococcus TaxID=1301 RepID=UPI0029C29D5B|nr:CHAP domain-containing protein [Streptococcus anginosus]MDX5003906.1 CHAP domain-containing protein [Streptococcus anginosus]MDX5025446.1 CHAP domain-containing protein [Streptococcus anginosus]MDX5034473.1 CHAP domain-containing protein [Streptococcus anginosus]MDX5101560.1 CHAP domain-containing protein [Streptococcus anginosus]
MATTNDVILFAENLANTGVGTDADGAWGTQCVDLPNSISINFFGKTLWGNAIDLLNSAASLGYEVEYNQEGNLDSKPRAGAVFVMDTTYIYGHEYGHTGLVIEDSDGYTMRTIEQNIDGNADSLYIGGPARYNTRNFDGVVGWFYFPTDDTGYQPATSTPSGDGSINEETGIFTVEVSALNVRAAAGLDAEIVAVYTVGQEINYDGWCDKDGYIWITYIGGSGNRRYVAVGQSENGRRVTNFGSFR